MLAVLIAALGLAIGAASKPANVLVIVPDDLGYDDFGFTNPRPDAPRTPHLDRLAKESVSLSDFHVSPTCSPSRAALMTGRYNNTTGVWHTILGRYFLREGEITMAEIFRANGYRTALFGKWHLGVNFPFRPRDRGFDDEVIIRGGGIDQQTAYWGNRNTAPSIVFDNDLPVELDNDNAGLPGAATRFGIPAAFTTNYFTTRAMEYVGACRDAGRPFFVYLPYNVAHDPQDTPPDARKGVDGRKATIENLDRNVGRILAYLSAEGLADDTLLVFLPDNGMANAMLRGGKASEYEGGHRVPCMVRWKAGGIGGAGVVTREVANLVSHIDLLPTLMDLLGLRDVATRPPDVSIDGRSFRTLLDGDPANDDPVFDSRVLIVDNQRSDQLVKYKQACVMQNEPAETGRTPHRWRLIRPSAETPWQLFDLHTDSRQKQDLADRPDLAPTVQRLRQAYEDWWERVSGTAAAYNRQRIGSSHEPVTCLYAHDWHTDSGVPWTQTMVAAGMAANGFHAVTFERAGEYVFDLRRWPKEISSETTLTSALRNNIRVYDSNALTRGRPLPIRAARLRVWNGETTYADETAAVSTESSGPVFTLRLPSGPACVQTWFLDGEGRELCGAYYVYVGPRAPGAGL